MVKRDDKYVEDYDDFLEVALEMVTYPNETGMDHIWAYPQMLDTQAIMYNKDIFELAGKYGIKVISMEVTHDRQIEEISDCLAQTGQPTGVILQIGTRNTQNFELLKSIGRQQEFPVLLKRGFGIHTAFSTSALTAPIFAAAATRAQIDYSFYVDDVLLNVARATVQASLWVSCQAHWSKRLKRHQYGVPICYRRLGMFTESSMKWLLSLRSNCAKRFRWLICALLALRSPVLAGCHPVPF